MSVKKRSDHIDLEGVRSFAATLSPWAHLATVGRDVAPDVVPVHPCWEGDLLWAMVGTTSVKAHNVAVNPNVALHWQVTEVGDGVELWGHAQLHDDLETKQRLWQGIFDYDLNLFSPGGPEGSPQTGFLAVVPRRAVVIHRYGVGGTQRWRADG